MATEDMSNSTLFKDFLKKVLNRDVKIQGF